MVSDVYRILDIVYLSSLDAFFNGISFNPRRKLFATPRKLQKTWSFDELCGNQYGYDDSSDEYSGDSAYTPEAQRRLQTRSKTFSSRALLLFCLFQFELRIFLLRERERKRVNHQVKAEKDESVHSSHL